MAFSRQSPCRAPTRDVSHKCHTKWKVESGSPMQTGHQKHTPPTVAAPATEAQTQTRGGT
eukprot:8007250-Pyramimonas_sp.AAC.1